MEAISETDFGPRGILLSAALHAAVLGLAWLTPPGTEVLALDELHAPRPRAFLIAAAPIVASVRAGAASTSTPEDPGSRPRASGAPHRGRPEPTDVLAAIAGQLSTFASAAPAFDANVALAALGASEIRTDGHGLDMIGTGRGAQQGGDTIGGLSRGSGIAGQWASCGGDELEARTAVMGRLAAIASCNAGRSPGLGSRAGFSTNGVARDAPDALDASPSRGARFCGCFESEGSLEAEVIRRIVARHRSEIRGCYQHALEHRPDLEGRVTARWIIAPSGAVQSANIDTSRSDTHDAAVESCIASAVGRWSFPSSRGPSVVSYPFVLGTSE